MKIETTESDDGFRIDLTAESVADSAFLVRMSMNRTNELKEAWAWAFNDNSISGTIVIGRRSNYSSVVEKKK